MFGRDQLGKPGQPFHRYTMRQAIEDQLFFDQIIQAAIEDGSLREAAAVNPEEKFSLLFSGLLETLFIERMEQNEDIFARFMNERDFQNLVSEWISRKVYARFRSNPDAAL